MFALGFLIIAVIFFLITKGVATLLPTRFRTYFVLTVMAIPVSFPFWHYLYPSYHSFQKLCVDKSRYLVKKTIAVDFVYADHCYAAFKQMRDKSFKGYECNHWPSTDPKRTSGETKFFKFTPAVNFKSSSCQDQCVKRDYYHQWEADCQSTCFDAEQILKPTVYYSYASNSLQHIEDRLIENRKLVVDENNENLVTLKNYVYYPYGNGFAKIFGLASGDAPTLNCEKKYDTYALDFLQPIQAR